MSQRQRIAFVCHPYHRGGVTRWMADAAMAAAMAGHDVYFVTVFPIKPFFSAGGRETMMQLLAHTERGMHHIAAPAGRLFEFGTEEYRANIYRRQIQQFVPAGTPLIVSDDIAVWSAAASVAEKYPMIGVLHGDQDYYYDRARQHHQQLSLCVCVSKRITRTLQQKCPELDTQKIHTIPCGIHLLPFAPEQRNDDTLHLTFIGRLTDYEKRAKDLVKIAAELHRQNISFHLNIVGNDDASKVAFEQAFKERGTDAFVTFHGWQPKPYLQRLMNRTDIVLLTSNSEGMPLVMMEALASGCGFTGTRVSGIEDYEHDPRAAGCVSVYTVGDIADAISKITRLAAIPKDRRQQAARTLAEGEFGMDICLQRYFAAIAGLKGTSISPRKLSLSLPGILYSYAIAIARTLKMRMANGK